MAGQKRKWEIWEELMHGQGVFLHPISVVTSEHNVQYKSVLFLETSPPRDSQIVRQAHDFTPLHVKKPFQTSRYSSPGGHTALASASFDPHPNSAALHPLNDPAI